MALRPLNRSRRVEGSKYRAQPGTNRAIHQYGNPEPKISRRPASSLSFAKASAYTRAPRLDAIPVASRERTPDWRWLVLERVYPLMIRFPFVTEEWESVSNYLDVLERRYEEDRIFDDFWFDIMASEKLYEEIWILDGSWGRESWVKVEKVARSFHLRLARVFEYTPKTRWVALQKSHAHPDGTLTLENINDDVGLLSNDLIDKELAERWKAGPGRKKSWRTAPRRRLAKKDRTRLLRCSQQREATIRSCSTPSRNSELNLLIKQASSSFSVPIVMIEHGMAGQNGSQIYPKPSVLKNAVRRFKISKSNMSWPRTRSKPFPPKAVRLVDGDAVDGGDGVDDEEEDDDSFKPGPSDGYLEGDRLSDMGNDFSKNNLPRCGSRGRRSKLKSLTHLIAYESFIGTLLGRSFRLKGLIRAESCYDLYAVEPMFETSQTYEARAYLFQGLKPREQKYRRRHFKRCQGNRLCEQSLDQGGKKWVVSRCVTTSKNEKGVLLLSPSPPASCKEIPVVPSCYEGKPSDSPSQIPTIAVPEQLDRVREPTRNHAPNVIRNITQESVDAYRAMRPSRIQLRADSVQINLEGSGTLGENHTKAVAEGSAVASSSPRPANGQETLITPIPHHKEIANGDSTSGSRKRKSPEQLERRRERRRRAQRIRRLTKTDKQNKEPTPRVFMQWERSEVQRLLYKQELALKSAHRAELQKLALALKLAHRAELIEQELALMSAHRAELLKQEIAPNAILKERDQKHIEDVRSMLSVCKRMASSIRYYLNPADHSVRGALLLLDGLHNRIILAIKDLVRGGDVHNPPYERLHFSAYKLVRDFEALACEFSYSYADWGEVEDWHKLMQRWQRRSWDPSKRRWA